MALLLPQVRCSKARGLWVKCGQTQSVKLGRLEVSAHRVGLQLKPFSRLCWVTLNPGKSPADRSRYFDSCSALFTRNM
ncbi:hypothetical protein RRG08_001055 [Elysia crispata]|uniref:Uncharacterized protein n=1 Tax=Elysia crispata TaxID=231223 RepID=A0AAE1AXX1_9GAST|nr:hypothetical protein RRG08_001055 [Elysia crispata]